MPQPPGRSSSLSCKPACGGAARGVKLRAAIAQFDEQHVAVALDGHAERLVRVPFQRMIDDVAAALFQRQREAENDFLRNLLPRGRIPAMPPRRA